jgi:hypothetical protein
MLPRLDDVRAHCSHPYCRATEQSHAQKVETRGFTPECESSSKAQVLGEDGTKLHLAAALRLIISLRWIREDLAERRERAGWH